MARSNESGEVTVWGWLWRMLVLMLPCIGVVMIFIWAFAGGNETSRNFFRAVLALMLIGVAISAGMMLAGMWPIVEREVLKCIEEVRSQ